MSKKDHKNRVIETKARLSTSVLWELQEKAYSSLGPEAWAKDSVPFYITSNPSTIHQYVALTLGYIRDCIRNKLVDPKQPFYIFDLGAGSGRFGYLYIKKLLDTVHDLYGKKLNIRYVMTDFIGANIVSLKQHPYLLPFMESGVLDFALYKHDQVKPLRLTHSNTKLNVLKNPCVIICNYYFDSIPQDFYRVKSKKLEEGRISLESTESSISVADPQIIQHLKSTFNFVGIKKISDIYPNNPKNTQLIQSYLDEEHDDLPLIFPTGPLQTVEYFKKLSNGQLLMIAGDQGVTKIEQMKELKEPHIHKHDTFSLPVCYHALSRYFEQVGGLGLTTTFSDPRFVVMAAVAKGSRVEYRETYHAFKESIDAFEPKDYWSMVEYLEKEHIHYTLDFLLLLLKFGRWDPVNFYTFYEAILSKLTDVTEEQKRSVLTAAKLIDEQFYPVDPSESGVFINLGVLCFQIEAYDQALVFFEKALDYGGESVVVLKNLVACHVKLGNTPKAFQYLEKVNELEKKQASID